MAVVILSKQGRSHKDDENIVFFNLYSVGNKVVILSKQGRSHKVQEVSLEQMRNIEGRNPFKARQIS